VTCRTGNLVHAYKSEDTAVALLEFEGGALGTVDACFNIPDRASRNRLELYGSKGGILAEGTIGQGEGGEMILRLEDAAGYEAGQARDLGGGIRVDVPTANLYKSQIEDVSAAIAGGRQPLCDGAAGLWSQKVLAACYESARTGRTVVLQPPGSGNFTG
jgi:predicted dehydrogenase